MTFSPVKSNPWKAGLHKRRRSALWPAAWWRMLVEEAKRESIPKRDIIRPAIGPRCLELIRTFNAAEAT